MVVPATRRYVVEGRCAFPAISNWLLVAQVKPPNCAANAPGNAQRQRGVPAPSLPRLRLSHRDLVQLGLSGEAITSLYRTLYVFAVASHEHMTTLLTAGKASHRESTYILRMWKTCVLLSEELGGQTISTSHKDAMLKLIRRKIASREAAIAVQRAIELGDTMVAQLQFQIEALQVHLATQQQTLHDVEQQLNEVAQTNEVLKSERDTLGRKNQFLASSLNSIHKRDLLKRTATSVHL